MPVKRRGGSASDGYGAKVNQSDEQNSCGRRERIPSGHKDRGIRSTGKNARPRRSRRVSPVFVLRNPAESSSRSCERSAHGVRVYGASAAKKVRARRQEGTSSWRGSALPARPWPRQMGKICSCFW